jgi:DNA-binding LytR/AlgR family response regulator
MKVLIIEDEIIAAERLIKLLKELDDTIVVERVLDSIESAVSYFKGPYQADLLFMDIELGDGQSFQIFDHVQVELPIIFTTAYREHTLQAFKLHSIDYLLKPVNREDLLAAIQKFQKFHQHAITQLPLNISALIKELQEKKEVKTRFLARTGTRLISTAADQIAYFYTKDKQQYIKTIKNEDFIIDSFLDEIETEIDPKLFFRANRQFILNYNHIEKVHSWFNGKLKVKVTPASYEEIIVSRLRAADFKKWLGE